MAIMKTMAAMPQEMPNIVSVLRSLCAQMFRSGLDEDFAGQASRQHQFVACLQPFQHLGALAVGDADLERDSCASPCLAVGSRSCTETFLSLS